MTRWTGPFQIRDYLNNTISRRRLWQERWPPEGKAIYLVSDRSWRGTPKGALYVGGCTGQRDRFVARVGDLIADLFGFFGEKQGHHSGARRLWKWCDVRRIHPMELWLAWSQPPCPACAERELFASLPRAEKENYKKSDGLLNRWTPPVCKNGCVRNDSP